MSKQLRFGIGASVSASVKTIAGCGLASLESSSKRGCRVSLLLLPAAAKKDFLQQAGEEVRSNRLIAKNYLTSWLLISQLESLLH